MVSTSRLPSLSCTATEYVPFSVTSNVPPVIALPEAKTSCTVFAPLSHLASFIVVLDVTFTVTLPFVHVSAAGVWLKVMLIVTPESGVMPSVFVPALSFPFLSSVFTVKVYSFPAVNSLIVAVSACPLLTALYIGDGIAPSSDAAVIFT